MSDRLCPGCRSLDGEHDFGATCTLVDDDPANVVLRPCGYVHHDGYYYCTQLSGHDGEHNQLGHRMGAEMRDKIAALTAKRDALATEIAQAKQQLRDLHLKNHGIPIADPGAPLHEMINAYATEAEWLYAVIKNSAERDRVQLATAREALVRVRRCMGDPYDADFLGATDAADAALAALATEGNHE